ncbi:MFS transporter [candidate division KSB1 bacterium]|nr:MFS transporter [candidate division KSB1 bacterium]
MTASLTTKWHHSITREQWHALFAAQLGWMLDAMDVMLYAFALSTIRTEFQLSGATAGVLASVTLLASAFGGIFFGWLADRIGRARALVYTILIYSFFTAMTATAANFAELLLWRMLVGLGLGGEWSAGSVLVAETWPAEHRGKAIGIMQSGWALGYILAAVLSATILPTHGWRLLFVIGILPAFLTFWIRKRVAEPALWREQRMKSSTPTFNSFRTILRPPHLLTTLRASLVTTSVLFAYWGLFTWLPTFLATPVVAGGAGLSIVKSSVWIIPMQAGAFLGYMLFGFLSDRFGRKPSFLVFLIAAAVLVPIYGAFARSATLLLLLGPLLGFFGHGYFSVFGALLAELFPTSIRGVAQGFTYNVGRAFSALAPFTIGALADAWGIGSALVLTSAFFLLGAGLMKLLPETKGSALYDDELR